VVYSSLFLFPGLSIECVESNILTEMDARDSIVQSTSDVDCIIPLLCTISVSNGSVFGPFRL